MPLTDTPQHTPPSTLNLVGGGRVAQTLGRLWTLRGTFAVQDVLTTSLASAQAACAFIGAGQPVQQMQTMRGADVWMLAVPDAQLASCALALAAVTAATAATQAAHHAHSTPAAQAAHHGHSHGSDDRNASGRLATQSPDGSSVGGYSGNGKTGADAPIAFHCSGAQAAATLAPLAALGWRVASAHCLLSFASAPVASAQFPGTPCALEGDATACATLRPAFTAIGAQCFDVASADKLLYHAGAVFATNFLPVLQAVAEDLWQSSGMPAVLIPGLRASLLRNAVANITTLGPQAALTGPAARGDTAAIARQGAAVAGWDAQTGAAYEALSALAVRLARRGRD